MTKREQLREEYEDALFALMMDEFAVAEGEKALEENERLKKDYFQTLHRTIYPCRGENLFADRQQSGDCGAGRNAPVYNRLCSIAGISC